MAIVSKITRCAVCGSTDVTFSETTKRYHCASCGADEAHAMNAADVAAINSIAALGDTAAIPTWTSPAGPARTASRCDLTPSFHKAKTGAGGRRFLLCLCLCLSPQHRCYRAARMAASRSP